MHGIHEDVMVESESVEDTHMSSAPVCVCVYVCMYVLM